MAKLTWEKITPTTQRLEVYGGWIVSRDIFKGHTWMGGASDSISVSLVFVPDPKHRWVLEDCDEK